MPTPIIATEAETRTEAILHRVARALGAGNGAAPTRVLIGGTALRIADRLPRPSTDLDLGHLVDDGAHGETEVPDVLKAMGFTVVFARPDGRIPIRTNIVIRKSGWRNVLGERTTIVVDNIRTLEIDPADVVKREGIWTTNTRKLLELKLDSIEDMSGEKGKRIAARDLFDVVYLLEKQEGIFTPNKIKHLSTIMEMSVYGAAQPRWAEAFTSDAIMRRTSLIEVADEIERRIAAYKAEFERRTGTPWETLDKDRTGETPMARIRTRTMEIPARSPRRGVAERTTESVQTTQNPQRRHELPRWVDAVIKARKEAREVSLKANDSDESIEIIVNDEHGQSASAGTAKSVEEFCAALQQAGAVNPAEVPELIRTLERERVRQIALGQERRKS